MACAVQLTDDLVEASFPGVGSVESLRAALADSTAVQREEDQREAVHEALIRAVADCVDADIPDSAIRQLAENEYQAKLHEIQLKARRCTSPCMRQNSHFGSSVISRSRHAAARSPTCNRCPILDRASF